ncbi:MAG: TauD/TfdA family dioxygenase [Pseudomonadota bacterium]
MTSADTRASLVESRSQVTNPIPPTTGKLRFQRLSPAVGIEVIGLDVANCTDTQWGELFGQWTRSDGVIVIRDAQLTPAQHVAFASRFGTPTGTIRPKDSIMARYYHPDQSEIYRVSNKTIDGLPLGREDAGTYWHSDGSTGAAPPRCSLLHALEIPPYGGDTQFASMALAYDMLSDTMKEMLHGLKAVHSLANTIASGNKTSYGKELDGKMEQMQAKTATHPVVLVHPDSGRRCLFVNPGFTSHIVGMHPEESAAILKFLFAHCIQPEFIYRHRYSLHDLVIWDNRCTIHYAVSDYKSYAGRYMHRVTVKGEAPTPA